MESFRDLKKIWNKKTEYEAYHLNITKVWELNIIIAIKSTYLRSKHVSVSLPNGVFKFSKKKKIVSRSLKIYVTILKKTVNGATASFKQNQF